MTWAKMQQQYALGYYCLVSGDSAFRREENERCEKNVAIQDRWKAFIQNHRRIHFLIKRHTIDVGYGADTIIRELLQNADDAYRGVERPGDGLFIEFDLDRQALIVTHAGRRFNEPLHGSERNDVIQICSMGGSEKENEHEIGRFGLGFKSVFAITSEPVILSHPFYFRIKHLLVPEPVDPQHFLQPETQWRQWVEDPRPTRFLLRVPPENDEQQRAYQDVLRRIRSGTDLRPTDLLFLRHVRRATAREEGYKREVTRSDRDATSDDVPSPAVPGMSAKIEIRTVREEAPPSPPTAESYLVYTQGVEAEVPTGTETIVRELECAVAFPWEAEKHIFSRPRPNRPSMLHLFLPTPEETGLPFLIHGEFLTTLGRTSIEGKHPCNRTLAEALARLVEAVLQAAFRRFEGDERKLLSVFGILPFPRDEGWSPDWLDPIRRSFVTLLDRNERVILTKQGHLEKPSECRMGTPLVHLLYDHLGPTLGPTTTFKPLVHPDIQDVLGKVQARAERRAKTLNSSEFARELFPDALARAEGIRRCRAVLSYLFRQQGDRDATRASERSTLLSELSNLRCVPTSDNTLGCPSELLPHRSAVPPDAPVAEIDVLADGDPAFARWILQSLKWAQPERDPPPPLPPPVTGSEILVTAEQQKILWRHNLQAIAQWWSALREENRHRIIDLYSLTSDQCFGLLGLGAVSPHARSDVLRTALREDTEEHRRTWFRVLCLANVGQSGRRFEDGVRFLDQFEHRFRGFERLWQAGQDGSDVVDELVREAIDASYRDRVADATFFWRRLYDFVKIRHLLADREFIEGFWDAADHHPEGLARYLHTGMLPGLRPRHRGLGESLSSQAFFICRETFRLGIITTPALRVSCYFPNRHLLRFSDDLFGPAFSDWPDFQEYERCSSLLHQDVERWTGSRDFGNAFDIPLLYLALEDTARSQIPTLATRRQPERVRTFLARR